MQFALNYSPQAFELIRDNAIDIDLFKCSSDFPELIPKAMTLRPVCVHFSLRTGRLEDSNFQPKEIEKLLQKTGTQFVNIHLGTLNEDFPDIPVNSEKETDRQRVVNSMINIINEITDCFGKENVMLENYPYHSNVRSESDILRATVDRRTINTVIEETECGFLLDIDHALVAAHSLGQDAKEYIEALPVKRIKELHMTGTRLKDGWLQSHLEMQKEDWEMFDWALENIATGKWSHPLIMAFEYGGVGKLFEWRSNEEVIATQVPEFQRMIAAHDLMKKP